MAPCQPLALRLTSTLLPGRSPSANESSCGGRGRSCEDKGYMVGMDSACTRTVALSEVGLPLMTPSHQLPSLSTSHRAPSSAQSRILSQRGGGGRREEIGRGGGGGKYERTEAGRRRRWRGGGGGEELAERRGERGEARGQVGLVRVVIRKPR